MKGLDTGSKFSLAMGAWEVLQQKANCSNACLRHWQYLEYTTLNIQRYNSQFVNTDRQSANHSSHLGKHRS